MKIIYLGAEVPSNRVILESAHAEDAGLCFWRLRQRGLPKTKKYLVENYFEPWMNVHAYPGIPDKVTLGGPELDDFCADYEDFIATNMDRLASFTDYGDKVSGTFPFTDESDKYWATIPAETTYSLLTYGIEQNNLKHLLLPGSRLENDASIHALARALMNETGVDIHVMSYARPDALRTAPWASVSTMAWLSPMRHGETIVWDGNQIVRYPARMKEQARPRYKHICEQAGLDFDKIMEDDNVEVCRLALWSYNQFELRNLMPNGNDNLFNNLPELDMQVSTEIAPSDVDNKGVAMRKLKPRDPSEFTTLPVFSVQNSTVIDTDEEGREVIKDVPIISSSDTSLRVCNTCFVASNCPAFKPESMCAFKLPVEIKTKDQLKALINAIIEMQGQRVAFARFSEEMNGGYPDPNLSQEIDRLFKLIKTVKELDDSSSFIKMTLEGRSAGAGVLSSIFGERAKVLNELPQAIDTEVIDAVISEDPQ